MRKLSPQPQKGVALITGLVFILIIGVVTVSTMQSSNLDYKISTNEVFKDIALQSSESGRTASGESIGYFMYERRWDNFDLAGLTFIDPSFDPSEQGPQSGEDLYNTSTLETDLSFSLSGSDIEDISASISVIKGAVNSNGSGLQQLAGYEGLGKGAGAGGTYMIFELRSTGNSAAEAVAVTASEYRVVP